jgi:hypothetical protein
MFAVTPVASAAPPRTTEASCVAAWNAAATPTSRQAAADVHATRALVGAVSEFSIPAGQRPRVHSACVVQLVGSRANLQLEGVASSSGTVRFNRPVHVVRRGRVETNAVVSRGGSLRLTGILSS